MIQRRMNETTTANLLVESLLQDDADTRKNIFYDMTNEADQQRLARLAAEEARVLAPMALLTRSDLVQEQARSNCRKHLREHPKMTNDKATFTRHYIEAFTDAYFEEIVRVTHHQQRSAEHLLTN